MCFGNCYFATDKPPLLYSANQLCWFAIYKIGGLNVQRCKTITLDKLVDIYGIPELIKIDVEGGEYECVSSLTRKVNNLCFEWASETHEVTFKCLDHLHSIGFTKFYIQYEDNYTYRPIEEQYITDLYSIKTSIRETRPKIDWGMVWCK
jgi:hypothetical protein